MVCTLSCSIGARTRYITQLSTTSIRTAISCSIRCTGGTLMSYASGVLARQPRDPKVATTVVFCNNRFFDLIFVSSYTRVCYAFMCDVVACVHV